MGGGGPIITSRPIPAPAAVAPAAGGAPATNASSHGRRDDDGDVDDDGEVDDGPYAEARRLAPPGPIWGDSGRRPGDRLRAKIRSAN